LGYKLTDQGDQVHDGAFANWVGDDLAFMPFYHVHGRGDLSINEEGMILRQVFRMNQQTIGRLSRGLERNIAYDK
jgi:hypothetical protein